MHKSSLLWAMRTPMGPRFVYTMRGAIARIIACACHNRPPKPIADNPTKAADALRVCAGGVSCMRAHGVSSAVAKRSC